MEKREKGRAENNYNLPHNFLFVLDFQIYLQSVEIHSANGVLGSKGG
jgi:hypothetical protein